jgi:hypothetical protein
MEFDCRTDNEDKVGFEAKVTLPDGQVVELQFRDFARIPSSISMDFLGNDEAQLWAAIRWGLLSPKTFPITDADGNVVEKEAKGYNVFRKMPAGVTMKIHREWQRKAGVSLGESDASETSSDSTEKS